MAKQIAVLAAHTFAKAAIQTGRKIGSRRNSCTAQNENTRRTMMSQLTKTLKIMPDTSVTELTMTVYRKLSITFYLLLSTLCAFHPHDIFCPNLFI